MKPKLSTKIVQNIVNYNRIIIRYEINTYDQVDFFRDNAFKKKKNAPMPPLSCPVENGQTRISSWWGNISNKITVRVRHCWDQPIMARTRFFTLDAKWCFGHHLDGGPFGLEVPTTVRRWQLLVAAPPKQVLKEGFLSQPPSRPARCHNNLFFEGKV